MPQTHSGKLLNFVAHCYSVVGLGVFGSVLTSKFVIGVSVDNPISSLSQVTGKLCIETGYPGAVAFLQANSPSTIVMEASPYDCLLSVLNGTAQARGPPMVAGCQPWLGAARAPLQLRSSAGGRARPQRPLLPRPQAFMDDDLVQNW